ncbi:hypothetical protein F511_06114 [Dorcoceras hygrometricum]|uniref:Uncharacterized protein n=1 Tax=Dorcoceras hygrometricum TaxID=472368 RepID=A0A2Z7DG49_9LAMI|nr:hypothetical protein F511_06114 [Dorcoceras hygrometricum]
MMDKLLLHYSRKKSGHGTVKSDSNIKLPPNRVSSLPGEARSPASDTRNGHARAFSLQPEMLNGNGHVHPKLPDYDDFVARLAALRGK